MPFVAHHRAKNGGFIESYRRMLLAGVTSLALIAPAGGALVLPAGAFAAPVPTESQTFQTPPSFADVIQRVAPAVVSIKVVEKQSPQMMSSEGDGMPGSGPFERFFFKQFGNGDQAMPQRAVRAEGSGFFVTDDGYIITNNHVVKDATRVDVVMSDGRTLSAKIVGTDPMTDLALLKVDGKDFTYVRLAKQPPRIGDWVIAMGNPFGLGGTATAGIVSASGRDIGAGPYDNFMQIDAPVNRGNSGGPTFNPAGEVVGVNTAIYSPSGGSVGIGFAIPADTVQSVYTALKDNGHVTRGALGVEIQPITQGVADALGMKDTHGALVDMAQSDSPAAKAGIMSGDVITAVDDKPIVSSNDLARRISMMQPGTKAAITYLRKGESKVADVTLEALPGSKSADAGASNGDTSGLPHLGMALAPSTAVPDVASTGVVVTNVDPNSIASDRGISAGDVILNVNGSKVTTPAQVVADLKAAKSAHKTMALLQVKSSDQTRFVAVPVA